MFVSAAVGVSFDHDRQASTLSKDSKRAEHAAKQVIGDAALWTCGILPGRDMSLARLQWQEMVKLKDCTS